MLNSSTSSPRPIYAPSDNMMVYKLVHFDIGGWKLDLVYSLFDKEYADVIILPIISSNKKDTFSGGLTRMSCLLLCQLIGLECFFLLDWIINLLMLMSKIFGRGFGIWRVLLSLSNSYGVRVNTVSLSMKLDFVDTGVQLICAEDARKIVSPLSMSLLSALLLQTFGEYIQLFIWFFRPLDLIFVSL